MTLVMSDSSVVQIKAQPIISRSQKITITPASHIPQPPQQKSSASNNLSHFGFILLLLMHCISHRTIDILGKKIRSPAQG